MKLVALGFAITSVALTPPIIGQQNRPTATSERLHLSAATEHASINFSADSIERQDPPEPLPSPYASLVRLKGDVVIRTCCVQKGFGLGKRPKNQRKQVVVHADEAEYRQAGEIDVRGHVRVNFQNYPN